MTNNRYKILLVEDEANIRTVMTAMLEAADYQVILAETCSLALNLFSSYQPAGCGDSGPWTSGYGWNAFSGEGTENIPHSHYRAFRQNQ